MPRVVVFDEFGGPDVLRIVEEPVTEPEAGEVRIRIEAFALNPLDVMMRSGMSPAPIALPHSRLGVEATGVVDAVGPGTVSLRVGDPVVVAVVADPVARGTYADYATLPASAVFARPDGLDVVEAAATWVGFSTAYGALVERAGMRAGDVVLVAGASGSVGRAAMQLAGQFGATPIAITRDPGKRDDLLAAGAASVVVSGRDDLVAAVRGLTGGAGADIVLDLVRGPGQRDLLRSTRAGGTLVAAGFLDSRPTPEPVDGSVTVVGYRGYDDLLQPEVVARMEAAYRSAVRLGRLSPAIDTTFDVGRVVDAHRRFDAGTNAGRKIVVTT